MGGLRAPPLDRHRAARSTIGSISSVSAPLPSRPDIDALVASLRARVEERRRAGSYPPGLEEDLASRFRRLFSQRALSLSALDLRGPLRRIEAALPLRRDRIPDESSVPGGSVLHRVIAKVVARQTQGVLEQVQAFAQPVRESLEALTEVVEALERTLREEVIPALDAVLERQAAEERRAAGGLPLGGTAPHRGGDG